MKSKQDNLRGFRGLLRREIRETKERSRNDREMEQLKQDQENIKIDCWLEKDKENNWMFIRLSFKKPLIPNDFIPELKMSLGEIFNEHF